MLVVAMQGSRISWSPLALGEIGSLHLYTLFMRLPTSYPPVKSCLGSSVRTFTYSLYILLGLIPQEVFGRTL